MPKRIEIFSISGFLALLFAVSYGGLLAGLPVNLFKDRENYLVYADNSLSILLNYWSDGLGAVVFNEPIWLLINTGLSIFLAPEIVIRVIVGIPASIVAYIVLRQEPKASVFLLFILLLPQVLNNHIVHIRQGLAVAFFLIGWFSNVRSVRVVFLVLSPFIHSSFFLVLFILSAIAIFRKVRLAPDVQIILVTLLGAFISVFLELIAGALGARQAGVYAFSGSSVSGLGFLFWSAVFFLYCLQGKSYLQKNASSFALLLFYLSTYFFIEVTGRIFESVILLVLLSGYHLTGWRWSAYIVLITSYGVLSYVLRRNLPLLGFSP